jgi:hypothetical protein
MQIGNGIDVAPSRTPDVDASHCASSGQAPNAAAQRRVARGARFGKRYENRRITDEESRVEGIVRIERLADRGDAAAFQPDPGRLSRDGRVGRIFVHAEQRFAWRALDSEHAREDDRVEDVIAHENRERLIIERRTRGEHRDAVLFPPFVVHVEVERESRGCFGDGERAHRIGVIAEDDVRVGDSGAVRGRKRPAEEWYSGDARQQLGVFGAVVKTIAIARRKNDGVANAAGAPIAHAADDCNGNAATAQHSCKRVSAFYRTGTRAAAVSATNSGE